MSSSESGKRDTAREIHDRMTGSLGSNLTGGERRIASQIIGAVAPEFHTLHQQVDRLHQRIDHLDERLTGKIDSLDERLSGKIDRLGSTLDEVLRAVQSGRSGNST